MLNPPSRREPAGTQAGPVPKVAVITGGSSGIGRCTAEFFFRRGWRVGLIARGRVGLDAACAEIRRQGGLALGVAADVADAAALREAALEIEARLGPIDVWINGAGNGVFGRFMSVDEAEFRCVTEVTYLGTVNGTRAALARMLPRDAGVIVNICSGIAFHGMPLLSSYSGAKQAVRGFTDALRAELRQDGSAVRIGIVFPPAVNTPFFSHAVTHMPLPPRPMRPVYQPDLVAAAIFRIATRRRRQITIGCVTRIFALLSSLAPRLIERAIYRLGYDNQMTRCEKAAALRNPTLFAPASEASPVRGPFEPRPRGFSPRMWLLPAGAAVSLGVLLALHVSTELPIFRLPARLAHTVFHPAPAGSAARSGNP